MSSRKWRLKPAEAGYVARKGCGFGPDKKNTTEAFCKHSFLVSLPRNGWPWFGLVKLHIPGTFILPKAHLYLSNPVRLVDALSPPGAPCIIMRHNPGEKGGPTLWAKAAEFTGEYCKYRTRETQLLWTRGHLCRSFFVFDVEECCAAVSRFERF